MNYKVGDEVICIDAQTIWKPTALVRGAVYRVAFLDTRCVAVDGVYPLHNPVGYCNVCGALTEGLAHFFPSRFVKPPEVTARSEVTSEAEAI